MANLPDRDVPESEALIIKRKRHKNTIFVIAAEGEPVIGKDGMAEQNLKLDTYVRISILPKKLQKQIREVLNKKMENVDE